MDLNLCFSKFPSYVLFVSLFNSFYGYFKNLSLCYFVWLECLTWSSRMFDWLNSQLSSEGKLYSSIVPYFFSNYCITYRDHPVSRRNVRTYPGTRRRYFWSPGQRCWINWCPELRFGRTKAYWPHRQHYKQAPMHNPIIIFKLCNLLLFIVHLSYWS